MMRNIIYLIALGVTLLFSACQEITVGYLEADAARYTIDTLHIVDANKELQNLKEIENEFYLNTQELQDEIAETERIIDESYDSDDFWDIVDPAMEDVYDAFDNGEISLDEYNELSEKIENDALFELYGVSRITLKELKKNLVNLAVDMGIGSLDILKKQIADFQQRIDFELPWASSEIEGVQGTQPLQFSVIGVKSSNQEAADKFMNYVSVQGNGMIYVALDVNVPPGNYTVSLKIENEGRSKLLMDIFTFVMDAK